MCAIFQIVRKRYNNIYIIKDHLNADYILKILWNNKKRRETYRISLTLLAYIYV